MVGPTATELESFKELIEFDHVYFKPNSNICNAKPARSLLSQPAKKAVSLLNPKPAAPSLKVAETFDVTDVDFSTLSESLESLEDLDQLCVTALSQTSNNNTDNSFLEDEPDSKKCKLSPIVGTSLYDELDLDIYSSPEARHPSDAGYSSDQSIASPKSDISYPLSDDLWEESFSELFPSLI